jgi:hypothetical protein
MLVGFNRQYFLYLLNRGLLSPQASGSIPNGLLTILVLGTDFSKPNTRTMSYVVVINGDFFDKQNKKGRGRGRGRDEGSNKERDKKLVLIRF